ncbi:unnamed protein product, partial [Durusdinium trenchii]
MLARLAEEVAALSLTHLSTKMDTDLAKLKKYFEEKQDHHNRQGNLDIKYLSDRYNRGVAKVQSYMDTHQQYIEVADMQDGLPIFIQQAQK